MTKKDGSTRFCVDYRRLNSLTTKDAYPLTRIDDSLRLLGNQQWFSTMDLASGHVSGSKAESGIRYKSGFVPIPGDAIRPAQCPSHVLMSNGPSIVRNAVVPMFGLPR